MLISNGLSLLLFADFNRFPGSRILTDRSWGDVVNDWAGKGETQMWKPCFSSFTDGSDATTFHTQCNQYNTTITFVRNSLGNTFGGYVRFTCHRVNVVSLHCGVLTHVRLRFVPTQAVGSWSKASCCATAGAYCKATDTYCVNHVADADFLFRLSPAAPAKYAPLFAIGQDPPPVCRVSRGRRTCTSASVHNYQFSDDGVFQAWGNHQIGQNNYRDLYLGSNPLGHGGYCKQGGTYQSGEVCGNGEWGDTSMEVYVMANEP